MPGGLGMQSFLPLDSETLLRTQLGLGTCLISHLNLNLAQLPIYWIFFAMSLHRELEILVCLKSTLIVSICENLILRTLLQSVAFIEARQAY